MRLGTANTYDRTLATLTTRQTQLSELQEKLSAGKKVIRASDDPTGAAQAERAMTRSRRVDVEVRALNLQRNSLAVAEGTLGNSMELLQNIRQLMIAAGDAGYSPSDRAAIAQEIKGMRDQLFGYANKLDSNGVPLFSGLGSAPQPFIDVVTGVVFSGIGGTRSGDAVSVPATMDGEATWMNVPTGNGVFDLKLGTADLATAPTGIDALRAALLPPKSALNATNTGEVWTGIGRVVNPGALTGQSYMLTFNVTPHPIQPNLPPTITYDVYRYDPVADPTGAAAVAVLSDQPYVDGQDISFDGITVVAQGKPADGDAVTITPSVRSDVFAVLDQAIASVDGAPNGNELAHALAISLAQIDSALERISTSRSQAGELLRRADNIESTQGEKTIQLAGDRSRAEDMDMIQGISEFQLKQTGYQAALQSYAQIQRLSLFNYLG
jgi:flagellar hook-associated protein 3 FlgL|uniref:flagellin N-terminal helical domain-containing protein n=1 Tax=Hylemonella sp. TaxID=2066020 RepID=UPI0035B19484